MMRRFAILAVCVVVVGCCPDCPPGMTCPLCPKYRAGAEMQSRIARLAADSTRCAESVRNENTFYRCAEPWWVIAPCGDTLYGHGCTIDSMGAGMNPDSSYHATLRELQRCLMQCNNRKRGVR